MICFKSFGHFTVGLSLLAALSFSAGCSSSSAGGGTTTGNPLVEDTSSSGAVAGAIGGALSGSSSNGVVAQTYVLAEKLQTSSSVSALAGTCPTYVTAAGATCSASGSSMWLTYSSCKFANSSASFTGTQAFFMSSGSASCGSFPNPGASGTLYRQYVTAASSVTPSSLVRISASSVNLAIDNHTTNLSNFDSATLTTFINGGYGAKVIFDAGGSRTSLSFGHRINTVGSFDQTVYGTLTVAETNSAASTRTVSGSIDVYHNGLQVIGTSVFSGLVHNNECCLPVSGSITTTFHAGSNVAPTTLGSLYVGMSETLTFTGCGTATLKNYAGSTESVSLNRCF